MSNCVAKCGIDCGACPWGPYPRKDMNTKDFESYRNNAKNILGYMPIKTACPTCQTPDAKIPKESPLPRRKCLIRQCVDRAGVANCAYCSRFPCDTMKATADAWNREHIEKKLGASLSRADYEAFVKPFEGLHRLEAIRASLKPEEIVEPAKPPKLKIKIADFPESMPFSKQETAAYKEVYKLLKTIQNSSLGMQDNDTFAQQHTLENLKAHVLRFLWILACYGDFENTNGAALVVDSITYEANRGNEKKLAIWSFVKDNVFRLLSEFSVCCERVALNGVKEETLTTGTGYLRSKGWIIRMSFEDKIGGAAALKALQTFAQKTDKIYGKKSFKHFQEVDMQVLLQN